jgi:hypothetical protein
MIRLTPFNVITVIMMAATAWVIWARSHKPVENNWPLFYYLGIVIYLKTFERSFDPLIVYIGLVSALFLRFEFLGGFILKTVRMMDLMILAYYIWRGLAMVMMW